MKKSASPLPSQKRGLCPSAWRVDWRVNSTHLAAPRSDGSDPCIKHHGLLSNFNQVKVIKRIFEMVWFIIIINMLHLFPHLLIYSKSDPKKISSSLRKWW